MTRTKHLVWAVPVALVLFLGSCVGFLRPAAKLADPMTHWPVDHQNLRGPFPVVVVRENEAWVEQPNDPHSVPPPPPGASYLIPLDRVRDIERYLRDHDAVHKESDWFLNVTSLSPDRQKVELILLGDGYWGGVYEATATTVSPLYRKVTGPGFSFIVGCLAILMNVAAWVLVVAGTWLYRRKRYAAQQPRAPADVRAS